MGDWGIVESHDITRLCQAYEIISKPQRRRSSSLTRRPHASGTYSTSYARHTAATSRLRSRPNNEPPSARAMFSLSSRFPVSGVSVGGFSEFSGTGSALPLHTVQLVGWGDGRALFSFSLVRRGPANVFRDGLLRGYIGSYFPPSI